MWRIAALTLLSLYGAFASAAGFDPRYVLRVGDFDSDNDLDIFVSATPLLVPVDEIPIVIPASVKPFVLRNMGNGDFTIHADLPSSQLSAMRAWAESVIPVTFADVNYDGAADLTIRDPGIAGMRGQIVFASVQQNQPPMHIRSLDQKLLKYKYDLENWNQDRQYFSKHPLRNVGSQPSTYRWFAAIPDPTDTALIIDVLHICTVTYSATCALSGADPAVNPGDSYGCDRPVSWYSPGLPPQPGGTVNVCGYDLHVYIYNRTSVTLQADASVFDTDAKETAEVLDKLSSCPATPLLSLEDSLKLERIMARVWQYNVLGQHGGPTNVRNSVNHPPFPGDGQFQSSDPTFHHYDVVTRVCKLGSQFCEANFFRSEVLRKFTYPAFKVAPTVTKLDGVEAPLVFVPFFSTGSASTYVLPIGHIKQNLVTTGYWTNAVQNITQSDHRMHPGTIARTLMDDRGYLTAFTHGVGINNNMCANYSTMPGLDLALRMTLAMFNDTYGREAFETLDKVMIKYWKDTYIGASAAQATIQQGSWIGSPQ